MGVDVRRAGGRYLVGGPGRETRHSFSFGPHYDPANVGFGPVVAHADDHVAPGHGYADHPHADTEVVTWVLEGALTHRDSRGRSGVLGAGEVQVMSAGSGIVHAETVDPAAGPTRFLQVWLRPDRSGGDPAYASAGGPDDRDLAHGLVPVVGAGALPVGVAGAVLRVGRPRPGVPLPLPDAGLVHVFVARGAATLAHPDPDGAGGPTLLAEGDAARLTDVPGLPVTATVAGTELVVWSFG